MAQNVSRLACAAVVVCAGAVMAAPPRYDVTDITNWTAAQKATLPFFKRYVAVPPAVSPNPNTTYFFPARNALGVHAFNSNTLGSVNTQASLLGPGGAIAVPAFGTYHWWACCPYRSADIEVVELFDVNYSGAGVGRGSMPGATVVSGDPINYHAFVFRGGVGMTDLSPGVLSATATCINNRGEIGGYPLSATNGAGYRRGVDGALTALDSVSPGYHVQPRWINARGVMIGTSVPGGWASESGSATFLLPRLFSMPLATASDVNDAGWIAGASETWDHTERYATLWEPNGDGTWTARDLTDFINTAGILLDRAVAIDNDGHIIAAGHLDGGDNGAYGTYLLTATSGGASWCGPDIGVHPASVTTCPGSVALGVVVVNGGAGTEFDWRKDGVAIDQGANPSAATATLLLSAASIGDSGTYECVVTNACGSATSNAAVVEVRTCCPADVDDDGDFGNGLLPDGGVDINDLLSFLAGFELGDLAVDLDDGSGSGAHDQAVDINDLLYFLVRFEAGC